MSVVVPEPPETCDRCDAILPEHRRTADGGYECARCGRVVPDPFVVARRSGP